MAEQCSFDSLVDIQTVSVDINLSKEERIIEFIRQIKNPYHFRYGKYTVRVRFNENGASLEEALARMMS